jgi:threonine/homoserine/homoserine lactone efflux protein
MDYQTLLAYTSIAAVSVVSPGPATLLALRNALSFGTRSVVWSSLGNISGLFLLSTASILGLGALLKTSSSLFLAVKILGAAYLIYLGLKQLFNKQALVPSAQTADAQHHTRSSFSLYREALLVAATNPKPVLFFAALFPQFLDTSAPIAPQFFILTGIFMAISFTSLLTYAALAGRMRAWLLNAAIQRWMNRVLGSVFIGFGAALLLLKRPATQ